MGSFGRELPEFAAAEAAARGDARGPAGRQNIRRGGRARRSTENARPADLAARSVRAVIVGTDAQARRGLRALMGVMPDVDVVAEAADGRRAAEQVLKHHPDLLLLTGHTPLIEELKDIPQIAELTELALLTWAKADATGTDDGAANGNGGQSRPTAGHATAGHATAGHVTAGHVTAGHVTAGHVTAGHATAGHATAGHATAALTRREQEVMALLAAGLSNRQIADELVVSQKTVKNHIYRIYQRIGVHERSQAVSHWERSPGVPAPR